MQRYDKKKTKTISEKNIKDYLRQSLYNYIFIDNIIIKYTSVSSTGL